MQATQKAIEPQATGGKQGSLRRTFNIRFGGADRNEEWRPQDSDAMVRHARRSTSCRSFS